jgi:hypothetical protein
MLHLFVPEQHDLALMKMVRGYENDIQAIVEIHQNYPLEQKVLTERFMEEMAQVNGDASYIRTNFILMMERIFSTEEAEDSMRVTENWAALVIQEEARKSK